ncbi:MAG TPA: IS21-like element helper ATPase IstB [Bdellovibrio sp.]|jgi:DNA replication protein DnaC|nr:IS21-like element helper ATPase IstB [Bdellovibrio sp.]
MLEQTRNQMAELSLHGMLKALDLRLEESVSQGWGSADFLSALVTDEKNFREVAKIQRRIRAANFRTTASFEQIDYTAKRSLTKTLVKDLSQMNYIKASPRNILILGPTGVGKTFLATALGNHACRHGYSAIFMGISVLCEKLLMARTDGTYLRLRDRLIKTDLLIIDDLGLKKLQPVIVQDLHDLLEERQERCTMITTQLPLKNWSEIIDDPLALDTIVDKLQHGSLPIILDGDSYRKKKGQREKFDN